MSDTIRNTTGAKHKYFRSPKTTGKFRKEMAAYLDLIEEGFKSRKPTTIDAWDDLPFNLEVYKQYKKAK